MILLVTPKGWTGPKMIDGLQYEGTWRSHSRHEFKFVSLETKDRDQWPYLDTAATHLLEPGGLPQEACE
jgi:phosphoketolase